MIDTDSFLGKCKKISKDDSAITILAYQSIFMSILSFFIVLFLFLGATFFLSKIDFPAPTKEIEKIIPNENFKIVK